MPLTCNLTLAQESLCPVLCLSKLRWWVMEHCSPCCTVAGVFPHGDLAGTSQQPMTSGRRQRVQHCLVPTWGNSTWGCAQESTTHPWSSQRLICSKVAHGNKALHAHNWRKPRKGLPSEVVETSSGHGPGQPPLADPALSRCVGLGDLQRCLHSTFLWSPLWEPYSCLEGGVSMPSHVQGHRIPSEPCLGGGRRGCPDPLRYVTGQSFQFQLF